MTATKTITKTTKAVTKTSTKSVPKSAAKTASLFYATTLAEALAGKYGAILQRFYVNACGYHLKALTVFPRARLAGQPLLNEADTLAFLEKHAKTSIPAGSLAAQRVFDEMMVQTVALKK